jgi:hypothetical protein
MSKFKIGDKVLVNIPFVGNDMLGTIIKINPNTANGLMYKIKSGKNKGWSVESAIRPSIHTERKRKIKLINGI